MDDPAHLQPNDPDQIVLLVVDDEALVLNMARIALEREGYFVLTAGNGVVALELSRKFPGTIHAILTDVQMPLMNGIELRDAIATERPGIPVMLMSGFALVEFRDSPVLEKPFDARQLKGRVRDLLTLRASG